MPITVRPVDLDREHEALVGILERNLGDLPHARRFRWIYRDNPSGPAWSWFACESASGDIIGVASLFRRTLWVGGEEKVCGQVGDFAIDASHRSLGPALLLQRATFEPVDRCEVALCYDCPPNDRGMATFRRLGMAASTVMVRYARPLRTERYLRQRCAGRAVAAAAAPIGNALLRAAGLRHPRARGLEVGRHDSRFGVEFTSLDRRLSERDVVRGRRAADDLNWRYRDDPLHSYEVLTARRRGELVGFLALEVQENDAFVVDLFGALSSDEAGELLEAAVGGLRARGVQTLHALVSDGNALRATLGRGGFRLRDSGPQVVSYTDGGDAMRGILQRHAPWEFTHSDVRA